MNYSAIDQQIEQMNHLTTSALRILDLAKQYDRQVDAKKGRAINAGIKTKFGTLIKRKQATDAAARRRAAESWPARQMAADQAIQAKDAEYRRVIDASRARKLGKDEAPTIAETHAAMGGANSDDDAREEKRLRDRRLGRTSSDPGPEAHRRASFGAESSAVTATDAQYAAVIAKTRAEKLAIGN